MPGVHVRAAACRGPAPTLSQGPSRPAPRLPLAPTSSPLRPSLPRRHPPAPQSQSPLPGGVVWPPHGVWPTLPSRMGTVAPGTSSASSGSSLTHTACNRPPNTPAIAKGWAEAPRSDTCREGGSSWLRGFMCQPLRRAGPSCTPKGPLGPPALQPQPLGPKSAPPPDTSRVSAAQDVPNSAQEGSWRLAPGSRS